MPTLLQAQPVPQLNMNGANTANALNGIASAFMDTGQQALRQQALAQAQQKQSATLGLGNVFGQLAQGQAPDVNAMLQYGAAAGWSPEQLRGYGSIASNLNDPNSKVSTAFAASGGNYAHTPQGIRESQQFDLKKQEMGAGQSAAAAAAARADAPINGMVNGQLVTVRTGDVLAGKVPGFQPLAGTDQMKAAAGANADLYPGIKGTNPVALPASSEDGAPPNAPMSPNQRIAMGLDSNKEPTVQNYVVRTPQGVVTGRTADGKTDIATGQPLPGPAQIVSPSNQGGVGGFVPGQTEQSNLRRDYTNARSLAAGAAQIADLVDRNPSLVGFTGNMARTAQSVIGQGQTLAKALGFSSPEQAGRAALATIAKSVDLNSPDVQKTMDPQFLMNLTDPNVHAIDRMHAVVTALAAPILFPGNNQYMYSKDAMNRVRSVIGDPNAWLQDPKAYSAGMRRLSDIAKQQADSSSAQLETGDVRSAQPLNINPGAAPGQGPNPAGNSPGGAPALTYVPGKGFQ